VGGVGGHFEKPIKNTFKKKIAKAIEQFELHPTFENKTDRT
jgi:hypothetical protein